MGRQRRKGNGVERLLAEAGAKVLRNLQQGKKTLGAGEAALLLLRKPCSILRGKGKEEGRGSDELTFLNSD